MLTTTEAVRQIVQKLPFVSEILQKDCLNLSQYAQNIKPEIEKQLYKKVQLGSIITALGRIRSEIQEKFEIEIKILDLSLKMPITEINFAKSFDHSTKISQLYEHLADFESNFLNIISGNTETGIFVNSRYQNKVLQIFKTQKPNLFLENLGAISIKFDPEYLDNIGSVYQILKLLVWENVNLLEVISTFTELTLIVERAKSQQVFEILEKYFT